MYIRMRVVYLEPSLSDLVELEEAMLLLGHIKLLSTDEFANSPIERRQADCPF